MRQWFWYKKSGAISPHIHHSGGWDPGVDFNDAQSANPTVQYLRTQIMANADFAGFIAHDCECDASEISCECPHDTLSQNIVVNGQYATKPWFDAVFNGAVVAPTKKIMAGRHKFDLPPGTIVSFALATAQGSPPISDGTVVIVESSHAGSFTEMLADSPVTLTFNGGRTNAVDLHVPTKGLCGWIGCNPVNDGAAQRRGIVVRGWA